MTLPARNRTLANRKIFLQGMVLDPDVRAWFALGPKSTDAGLLFGRTVPRLLSRWGRQGAGPGRSLTPIEVLHFEAGLTLDELLN